MTALAVDPSGTKLAVHASDRSQSEEGQANTRKYIGSYFSFLFKVSAADGSFSSKLMKLTHGSSSSSTVYLYQVMSSGFLLRDDGKIYAAFNMLVDDSNDYPYCGNVAKERMGCFDSETHEMDFYLERSSWCGRSASLAWRNDDGTDGFYLGGQTDLINGVVDHHLTISKFDVTPTLTGRGIWHLDACCQESGLCNCSGGHYGMSFSTRGTAGYIDFFFVGDKADSTRWIFGVSGRTDNYRTASGKFENIGAAPMVFWVQID